MKTKTRKLTVGSYALALIAIFFLATRNKEAKLGPRSSKEVEVSQPGIDESGEEAQLVKEAIKQAITAAKLPPDYVPTSEEREKIISKVRARAMGPTEEELGIMFETPVEVYGRVLDQFDQPVIGADIRCSWPFIGPLESPIKVLSSAPQGDFEIRNLKALALDISVYPPPGYAEEVRDSKKIQIAKAPDRLLKKWDLRNATPEQLQNLAPLIGGAESYKGDKSKPVIFRLKKL